MKKSLQNLLFLAVGFAISGVAFANDSQTVGDAINNSYNSIKAVPKLFIAFLVLIGLASLVALGLHFYRAHKPEGKTNSKTIAALIITAAIGFSGSYLVHVATNTMGVKENINTSQVYDGSMYNTNE